MKLASAFAAVIVLLLSAFSSATQAQSTGPVLQQVVITGHRLRFNGDLNAPAIVRYILIDPGNADPDPAKDGFAPLERTAVLVLFIGGDGAMGFTPGQTNTGSPNTVARDRYHLAAEGFVVAVVDAANDFNARTNGLNGSPVSDESSTRPSAGGSTRSAVIAAESVPRLWPTDQIGSVG